MYKQLLTFIYTVLLNFGPTVNKMRIITIIFTESFIQDNHFFTISDIPYTDVFM